MEYERTYFHEQFARIYKDMLGRKKRGGWTGQPNPDEKKARAPGVLLPERFAKEHTSGGHVSRNCRKKRGGCS